MVTGNRDKIATASDERERGSVDRLVFFTDAVIAIVITLMVLEVKPPHVRSEQELIPALWALWHEYLAVGVSFLVIGIFWSRHHRLFQWVRRQDSGLVWINLLFLMSVSAIPFVTAVLAQHPQQVGTILYAVTLALASLLVALLWSYAGSRARIAPELPAPERRIYIFSSLATAAVFLASVPIAIWHAHAAKFFWLAVLAISVARRFLLSRPTAQSL